MVSEILNYLLDAWEDFVDFAMMAFYGRVVPDWRFILRVFLLGAFVMGSAFLSATIAESRRHKMKVHFLLGLLVPYIYPLIIALRMKTAQEAIDIDDEYDPRSGRSIAMSAKLKDIQEEQKKKYGNRVQRVSVEDQEEESPESVEVEEAVEVEDVAVEAPAETEEIVEETAPVFTQRYFQQVSVDSSGAKAGPFDLLVKNGTRFKVCQIKNIQTDMASFEIEVGGNAKNIRVKYDNIESFEKI